MTEQEALQAYSRGAITAIELRRRLGGATYGEVLQRLGALGLPLPRPQPAGQQERMARARSWMFPGHVQPT